MNVLKKYITSVVGLQLFQFIRFGTLLLINILLAKSYFNTHEIGQYESFLFFYSALTFFWISGFLQAFLALFNRPTLAQPAVALFNFSALLFTASILIAALILFFFTFGLNDFCGEKTIPHLPLFLLYFVINTPTLFIEYYYLLKEKPLLIISYGCVVFVFQIVVTSAAIVFQMSIEAIIIALVLTSILKLVWLAIILIQESKAQIDLKFLRNLLTYSLPIVLSMLIGSSAEYIDGIIVSTKFDSSTFAIFRYGAKELPLSVLLLTALSTAMISAFSKETDLQTSLRLLRRQVKRLMHLLFPVSIILLLSSQIFYPLIFNSTFSESVKVFDMYLLLIISRIIVLQPVLIGLLRTKVVLLASLAELALNILCSLVFVIFWGIAGVAFATVLAFVFQKIIFMTFVYKTMKIKPNQYLPYNAFLLYSLLLIIVFCVKYLFFV